MKERLEYLMSYYNLSPAKFAEKIGVQRSSISHIISGRNKPSYDFILKILETFTDLNAEWLLLNRGNITKDSQEKEIQKKPESKSNLFENIPVNTVKSEPEDIYKSKQNKETESNAVNVTKVNNVESIIVLNTNGTFKIYKSEL